MHSSHSLGASSSASETTAPQQRRRRLERLVETCSGALVHELSTAAQYDLQTRLAKQQLQAFLQSGGNEDGHYDRRTQREATEVQLRHRLAERTANVGCKLSVLEEYNVQLVKVINDLRWAIQPHRQGAKQSDDEADWLTEAVTRHKQDMRKALDERDWSVKQLRYLQRQRHESGAQHADKMEQLLEEHGRLDERHDALAAFDRAALREEEEREGAARRAVRVNKLKREMHLGYLRSQLAQFVAVSNGLETVMGVRLDPKDAETLRRIIEHFSEKDRLVESLQMFWAVQVDEIEKLGHETAVLRSTTLKGAARRTRQDAHAKDRAARYEAQRAAEGDLLESRVVLEDGIRAVSLAVEAVASAAECKLPAALQTNGCTPANIYEYLTCVHNQLGDLERDGRVPPSCAAGTFFRLPPPDWAAVASGLEAQLPSTHEKDSVDWALEAAGEVDEEEHVHKSAAYIKWQSKRHERDRHLILWGEMGEQRGMGARDPLSASARPVTDKLAGGGWDTEEATEDGAASALMARTASGRASFTSIGSKRHSLEPYMDEPYSPTGRR